MRRIGLCLTSVLFLATSVSAQSYFEEEPILYGKRPTTDRVTQLQKQITEGKVKLKYDSKHGYLPAVLKALEISPSSQILVFSKTSFQLRRISPRAPRAIYFNDDTYVGSVLGGDVLEISVQDPNQGAVFFTIENYKSDKPRFDVQNYECTSCHASSMTKGIPGHVVRSVYTAPDGQPILRAGTFITEDSSPFKERWGGWYVTGTHGKQRHMGNVFSPSRDRPYELNRDHGANLKSLESKFNVDRYLTPHSDIVALLVIEHQILIQNLITKANFQTRRAIWDQQIIDEALNRPADTYSAATLRRIDHAIKPLLQAMLGVKSIGWKDPVKGTSNFTKEFSQKGIKDRKGRSLRDLDLKTRLFKYRLSPWIYSEAFDALPEPIHERFYQNLWLILTTENSEEPYNHFDKGEKKAILEILLETKKDLPGYWRNGGNTATF